MSELIFPSTTTLFFHRCYQEVRKEVMRSVDSLEVCAEKSCGNSESFVGFEKILEARR